MLSGTDFLRTLPANPSPARERAIFTAVRAGNVAPIQWWGVRSTAQGRSVVFYVSSDALRVGNAADSVRVNVSARTAQYIADVLGCILPTTRICDLVWEQAVVRLSPCISRADKAMGSTGRMVTHHLCVEGKLAGRAGLVETVGKNWVITNLLAKRPERVANYGWFDPAAPYGSKPGGRGPHRVWQPLGLAHDARHVDYSQTLRLVHRSCQVDGQPRDLVDVLRDPVLAPLVSDEGPMRLWRLPGVDVPAPLAPRARASDAMDAVILAGGVTKGAFTAGALSVLLRSTLPSPVAISQIVTASSGSLNGAYLAAALHRNALASVGDELRSLWLEHADVTAFAPSLRGIANGEGFSTTDKLRALLRRYVRPGVGHVPVRLRVVVSTALGELRPTDPTPATTFEHVADFDGADFHTAERLEDLFAAVVASAAFPLVFLPPMVRIRGVPTPCFDGGLCNNSPVKYAIEDPAISRVFVISPFPSVAPVRAEDARGAGLLAHLAEILINERLYRDLKEARNVNRGLEQLALRVPVKTLRDAMLDAIGWGGRRPIEIVEIRPPAPLSGNGFSGLVSRELREEYIRAGELAARVALDP